MKAREGLTATDASVVVQRGAASSQQSDDLALLSGTSVLIGYDTITAEAYTRSFYY